MVQLGVKNVEIPVLKWIHRQVLGREMEPLANLWLVKKMVSPLKG